MAFILKEHTTEQFWVKVRAAYQESTGDRTIAISKFIIQRITAGDVAEATLRSLFGANASQWASIKGKMQAILNAENTLRAAAGE